MTISYLKLDKSSLFTREQEMSCTNSEKLTRNNSLPIYSARTGQLNNILTLKKVQAANKKGKVS